MHYTLEAREDDCLQNHTVHVSIRVCRPFTKGGCAHGIRGEGELCSTYSLEKCFATCLTWWRRRISITQVHECLMQTSGIQCSSCPWMRSKTHAVTSRSSGHLNLFQFSGSSEKTSLIFLYKSPFCIF